MVEGELFMLYQENACGCLAYPVIVVSTAHVIYLLMHDSEWNRVHSIDAWI